MKRVYIFAIVLSVFVAAGVAEAGYAQAPASVGDLADSPKHFIKQKPPLGDYVPCMFNRDQRFQLRTLSAPPESLDKTSATNFERPDDVSCSFSILPWDETNYVFGRMVADNYVAIEVNIRNLNKDDEFLLHDIQVAIDTGLGEDSFGRFEAGRDKLIVRGVAQRGESDDIRNRVMNALGLVGTIAGGASGALTSAAGASSGHWPTYLSDSVSIFQGPVLSGLGKMFPDHTLDNVKNVSDLAFSASSTLKTVIPTNGSVPMVTFIAKKPLEELPFAWCGSKKNLSSTICSASGTGVTTDWASFKEKKNYKYWAPAALNILEHRAYVVVAGVHIIEVSKDAAADNVSCPTKPDGTTIELSAADSAGNITCTIAGTNLSGVKSAILKQGSTSISATLSPESDGNSATLGFKASMFKQGAGTYEIFSKNATGTETDLKKALLF